MAKQIPARSSYEKGLENSVSEKTKQELLDQLEQSAIIIGGQVVMATKIGLSPNFGIIEDELGNILDATLDLKKLEGIPSNLKKVEKS